MTTPPPKNAPTAFEIAMQARSNTVKRMAQMRAQRLDAMKEGFARLLEPERELSKDLFVTNFLPFFCGEVPSTPEVIQAWTHVAGNLFSAVRIVEHGKTIAIVPPLSNPNAFKPISGDQRRAYNADGIMTASSDRAAMDPVGAVSTAADGLTQRFLTNEVKPAEEDRQAWIDLLAVFGKTLDPKPAQATTAEAQKPESDEELEDYE